MRSISVVLAAHVVWLATPALAQGPDAGPVSCVPACRSGYVCSPAGTCVSACNPPCAANETCSAAGECVAAPFATPAPIAPAPPPAQPASPWGTSTPAPSPEPITPGWGAAPTPGQPQAEEDDSGANERSLLPRGSIATGITISRVTDSGPTVDGKNRLLLIPLQVRIPAGPLVIEAEMDHAVAIETLDFGFMQSTEADYTFGSPYLGVYATFGERTFFGEGGLGIAFPALQTAGDDLTYSSQTHATLATGLWDIYRFARDTLSIVPHYRADLVTERLVVGAEVDVPILIPVGDRRDAGADTEAALQLAIEGGFAFLGASVLGVRVQQIFFFTDGLTGSDRYQATIEPFIRLAPRGRAFVRAGLMMNLGRVTDPSFGDTPFGFNLGMGVIL